jgi:hypothetical protein
VRVEFKSKAVVHFGQHKAPIASASLADNGAVHTVAINALTVFDVVHAHPLLRASDWLRPKSRKVVVIGMWEIIAPSVILLWALEFPRWITRMAHMQSCFVILMPSGVAVLLRPVSA